MSSSGILKLESGRKQGQEIESGWLRGETPLSQSKVSVSQKIDVRLRDSQTKVEKCSTYNP